MVRLDCFHGHVRPVVLCLLPSWDKMGLRDKMGYFSGHLVQLDPGSRMGYRYSVSCSHVLVSVTGRTLGAHGGICRAAVPL